MAKQDERIHKVASDAAAGFGFELEDVELLGQGKRLLLRVTIDKPGGVTLDDCAAYSRDLSAALDVEDPIQGRYTLEVSSPGLDRPLKKPGDYMKCMGKLARIVVKENIEGVGTFVVGRIESADESGATVRMGDKSMFIPYKNIKKARLEIEL